MSQVVGIAAVKSHKAKPSDISPLYRKRVEHIPEFHDCPCNNILIPWLLIIQHSFIRSTPGYTTGALYKIFTLVGDISRRQVIFYVCR